MSDNEPTSHVKFLGFEHLNDDQKRWIIRHVFAGLYLGTPTAEKVHRFQFLLENTGKQPARELFRFRDFPSGHEDTEKFKVVSSGQSGPNGHLTIEDMEEKDLQEVLDKWVGATNDIVRASITIANKSEAQRLDLEGIQDLLEFFHDGHGSTGTSNDMGSQE